MLMISYLYTAVVRVAHDRMQPGMLGALPGQHVRTASLCLFPLPNC